MVKKIKDLNLGEGIPKIAVPITGSSDRAIMDQLASLDLKKLDIVEWRADFYKNIDSIESTLNILREIRMEVKEKPIIFTLRSKSEGGQLEITFEKYRDLNKRIGQSGLVDIVDIQGFFTGLEKVRNLAKTMEASGVKVIASYHNFAKTPGEEELDQILARLNKSGSIIKLASMATSPEDVFRLRASIEKNKSFFKKPIISISMGEIGKISRITRDPSKSCITYASLDEEVAPGQLALEELNNLLNSNGK